MDGVVTISILPIKQMITLSFSFMEISYEPDDDCSNFDMSDLGSCRNFYYNYKTFNM